MYLHIDIRIHMNIYTYAYIYTYLYVYIYIRTCIYTFVYTFTGMCEAAGAGGMTAQQAGGSTTKVVGGGGGEEKEDAPAGPAHERHKTMLVSFFSIHCFEKERNMKYQCELPFKGTNKVGLEFEFGV